MSEQAPLVSVVVLSYDRPQLLARALQSIAGQTCTSHETIVVDNRSPSSGRIAAIAAGCSRVRLVSNEENLGFTGGMNRGLAEARGEYVYLTEDDIELSPECLAELVRYLESHPEVALAGPVIRNRRDASVRCAGGTIALGTIYRLDISDGDDRSASAGPTMFLPGAAIAARTHQLRAIGAFHPEFFMYVEDVELCVRVLKAGSGISVVPAANVYHHEPAGSDDVPELMFHRQKNLAALYLLHAPFTVLPGFLLRYAGLEGLRTLWRGTHVAPWARAWLWVLRQSPRLLAERSRLAGG